MNTWNDAAQANLERIYLVPSEPGDINRLRRHLDEMINDYFSVDTNVDDPECRTRWLQLGRRARDLGIGLGYFDFFSGSAELLEILVRKQRDYGHENIARFGRLGLLVRIHDKIARLENLLGTGSKPNNESILDNVADVIGYCVIGAMWEEKTFLRALQLDTVVESDYIKAPVGYIEAPTIMAASTPVWNSLHQA